MEENLRTRMGPSLQELRLREAERRIAIQEALDEMYRKPKRFTVGQLLGINRMNMRTMNVLDEIARLKRQFN
jgi:hypothetical protein